MWAQELELALELGRVQELELALELVLDTSVCCTLVLCCSRTMFVVFGTI